MDVSVREELSGLVEEMTHSGSPSLDESQLKRLKRMCRLTYKPHNSHIPNTVTSILACLVFIH